MKYFYSLFIWFYLYTRVGSVPSRNHSDCLSSSSICSAYSFSGMLKLLFGLWVIVCVKRTRDCQTLIPDLNTQETENQNTMKNTNPSADKSSAETKSLTVIENITKRSAFQFIACTNWSKALNKSNHD